jgi:hypothetical protein
LKLAGFQTSGCFLGILAGSQLWSGLRFNRNQASLPEIRRCFPNLAVFAEFLPVVAELAVGSQTSRCFCGFLPLAVLQNLPVVPEFQHVPGFVPFAGMLAVVAEESACFCGSGGCCRLLAQA